MHNKNLHTERLTLQPLAETDFAFIQKLLNTEGWIKFIGNRNIHSKEDAIAYIKKIADNPVIHYWTVNTKDSHQPIGMVTLIQRDYLDQPDIGFAFLPAVAGKGYAYEAVKALLGHVLEDDTITAIHAVILPGNKSSIKLVEKLGLAFDKVISIEAEELYVYSILKK